MKPIKLIDFNQEYEISKENYLEIFESCIKEGDFVQGRLVKSFEESLKNYLNIPYIKSCGNGTDALLIAFESLGLKKGDKIAMPAFTFVAAAEMALRLELDVVWYDIDEFTYNINIDSLNSLKDIDIKALVVVHLFGQSGDLLSTLEFCNNKNIILIEDNAQSFGAKELSTKRFLGSFSKASTTSFFPTKTLGAFGDGGAIFFQDEDTFNLASSIANHGQKVKYEHQYIGVNSRLDTIQAGILSYKLENLEASIAQRVNIANIYYEKFNGCSGIILPRKSGFSTHVFHQYTIRVPKYRNELKEYLQVKGIPTSIHYPKPIYNQQAYIHTRPQNILVNTEILTNEVLSLPIHPYLDNEQLTYIAFHILEFFNTHG